jgi:hypothetical protein
VKSLLSREAGYLEPEMRTSSDQRWPLKDRLSLVAFGECCANNPINFGIQNGAGVTINVRLRFWRWRVSRPCELHRQIADDSKKHPLSDQNGSAGYWPDIGIGRAGLDVSLEATPRTGHNET